MESLPWANMRTNYELGKDSNLKATDYQARFAQTSNGFRDGPKKIMEATPNDQNKKNKAKNNDSDSIKIAGNDFFDRTVTSKMHYQDTSKPARSINQGLDKLTMGYITGSHFKPGYGGFGGQSENNRSFTKSQRVENSLDPGRIKFFKDAHFDHCDR